MRNRSSSLDVKLHECGYRRPDFYGVFFAHHQKKINPQHILAPEVELVMLIEDGAQETFFERCVHNHLLDSSLLYELAVC